MHKTKLVGFFCVAVLFLFGAQQPRSSARPSTNPQLDEPAITHLGIYQDWDGDQGGSTDDNGIQFHGGPVMGANPDGSNTPTIYYIWYGPSWGGDPGSVGILENYANWVGGSPYFNIQTSYYDGSGNPIINNAYFGGSVYDSGSLGLSISDSQIRTIVNNTLLSGVLPADPNGVYFVLTDPSVNETSGLCTRFCGWHTHYTSFQFGDIKYSFVGSPLHCSSTQCTVQRFNSPNYNPNADGIVNIVAHEFEESVTDPDLNAWYDTRGQENADKCAWTFGQTYDPGNGSLANMNLGGLDYLIQRNWVNDFGGYCDIAY